MGCAEVGHAMKWWCCCDVRRRGERKQRARERKARRRTGKQSEVLERRGGGESRIESERALCSSGDRRFFFLSLSSPLPHNLSFSFFLSAQRTTLPACFSQQATCHHGGTLNRLRLFWESIALAPRGIGAARGGDAKGGLDFHLQAEREREQAPSRALSPPTTPRSSSSSSSFFPLPEHASRSRCEIGMLKRKKKKARAEQEAREKERASERRKKGNR